MASAFLGEMASQILLLRHRLPHELTCLRLSEVLGIILNLSSIRLID